MTTEAPAPNSNTTDPALSEALNLLNQQIDGSEQQPIDTRNVAGLKSLLSEPEIEQMRSDPNFDISEPAAVVPEIPWESPGIVARTVGRLLGTDVDDPLPWTRLGTTIAGMIGGTALGSQVPGPPALKGIAAVAGGVGGTAVGAVAPETVLEGLEQVGILRPGERERIGLSNEQLMTVMEGEALLDLATLGGVSIARGVGRGMSSVLTGANRGTRGMAEAASREGIALLPVQVGERQLARGFVSVLGRFPWIAAGLKKRANRAMDQISTAFDGIPERLGPLTTFDEAGGRILREAQDTSQTIAADFRRRFDAVLARADMNGIRVRPVNVRAATDAVMKQLDRAVPVVDAKVHGTAVPLQVNKGDRDLRRFLNSTTRRIFQGTQIGDFTVRQMDSILTSIDEKMVEFASKGDNVSMGRLERVRNAVQADLLNNSVSRNSGQPLSQAGQDITREFRQLDQELTESVNFLFNSATGQRLGFKISPTQRGAIMQDPGMRGADAMAKVLLRGDSPNAVAEIARLVQPETMQRLGNAYFTEAVEKSMIPAVEGQTRRFDVDSFAKSLGLNNPNSGKFAQTQAIMQHAGGMTMDELQSLVAIARRASEAEIPDVSSFIARQATFTGLRGAVRAAIPFATLAGAGGLAGGGGGAAVTGILAVGGARLLSSVISNPASARAFRRVMDTEARTAVKRAAFLRATTLGINQMFHNRAIDQDQADAMKKNITQFTIELDRAIKNEQNR